MAGKVFDDYKGLVASLLTMTGFSPQKQDSIIIDVWSRNWLWSAFSQSNAYLMVLIVNSEFKQFDFQDLSGTFAGLMDLYERNYIGVRRLVPHMPPAQTTLQSHVPGGLTLHMEVLERFPYTTELALTYYFARHNHMVAEPDIRIRVYTDARLAEVVSAHLRHWPAFDACRQDGFKDRQQLRFRWQVNRFLCKWLSYCLHQGHHFREIV